MSPQTEKATATLDHNAVSLGKACGKGSTWVSGATLEGLGWMPSSAPQPASSQETLDTSSTGELKTMGLN